MYNQLYSTDYGKLHRKMRRNISRRTLKVSTAYLTSPFPLNNKKQYGNLTGDDYLQWFSGLRKYSQCADSDGSIVIEMGNAWEKNLVQSLLTINSLLSLLITNERLEIMSRICLL